MPSFEFLMKDGTTKKFNHQGRAGGSYTKYLEFVDGFVVVVDEWGNRQYIPSDSIHEINERPTYSGSF